MSDDRRTPPAPGEALFRTLLWLFPRAFRDRYADDMMAFYRERALVAGRPPWRIGAIWPRLVADLVTSAVAEHFAASPPRRDGEPIVGAQNSRTQPEETMSTLQQDLRFALRGIRQRPAFTSIVLATIALGIGANAAIFSVVNAVLLRPLPFAHVDRIVNFTHTDPYGLVSEPEFIDYQRGMPSMARLAAYNTGVATVAAGDESIRAIGSRGSSEFFHVLGVTPLLGRTFTPDEYVPGSKARVTVISSGLWRQRFAGDMGVVGKTIHINGAPLTVIGVMPQGFNFPQSGVDFWTPWQLNPDSLWTRNNHYLRMVGELAPGATLAQARVQAATLDARWVHDFPDTYFAGKPPVADITPLRDHLLGATRPYLLALIGAVAFILLIACANVANLLLVRGEARRKEFAIRTALGASRERMVRQMLTESMTLATLGAVLGIGVAWAGARSLVALAPGDVPRLNEVGVDYRVVAFTVSITLLTGLLFGLVPALRGLDGAKADALRDGGRTSAAGTSRVVRGTLVAAEIALAVMMLSGAGLLIRSLIKLRAVDLGFATEHVLTMDVTIPPRRHYNDTTADELFRQIRLRVSALPGVVTAAMEGALPITGDDSDWSILLDGRVVKTIAEAPTAKPDQVTPDFFNAMSVRVLRGRAMTEDDRMGAPPVVVINETMAKLRWPGVDPIGHTLKMFNPTAPWVTIVGVVSDMRWEGYQGRIRPTMFFPYSQTGKSAYYQPSTMTLVVRTTGDPATVAPSVRSVVRSLDAYVPISNVKTLDDVIGQSIASRRFTTILLAGFAALALLLAGIGIYGVISFGVSQRTSEIGLRMALGATSTSVMQLFVREGLKLALVGGVVGLTGAAAVDRLLRSLLVDVTVADVPTMTGVVIALVGVAALACAVPARRAMAVDPTAALRDG